MRPTAPTWPVPSSSVVALAFFLCLAGASISVSAQIRQPAGTFRLAIGPKGEGDEAQEVTFNLECPGGQALDFEHLGALRLQSGWNPELDVSNRTAEIKISLIPKAGKYEVAVGMETSAHVLNSGLSVTNANLAHYELESAQVEKIKTRLEVTATNGLYKLDSPLVLGTFLDKPLQVTIGRKRERK